MAMDDFASASDPKAPGKEVNLDEDLFDFPPMETEEAAAADPQPVVAKAPAVVDEPAPAPTPTPAPAAAPAVAASASPSVRRLARELGVDIEQVPADPTVLQASPDFSQATMPPI